MCSTIYFNTKHKWVLIKGEIQLKATLRSFGQVQLQQQKSPSIKNKIFYCNNLGGVRAPIDCWHINHRTSIVLQQKKMSAAWLDKLYCFVSSLQEIR